MTSAGEGVEALPHSAPQRQIVVAAHLKLKQLLLFDFTLSPSGAETPAGFYDLRTPAVTIKSDRRQLT